MAKRPAGKSKHANVRGPRIRVVEEEPVLIRDLWRGNVELVKTFWIFGFGAWVAFAILFAFIEYQSSGMTIGIGPLLILGLMFFYFVYMSFINVAVWRSANKYRGSKTYMILAKFMVIVSWCALIREAWQIYSLAPG